MKSLVSALHVGKILAGAVTGAYFLDPIEVFYLPEQGLLYPINSKAGCSTVKATLIRYFLPEFCAQNPEIHQLDPTQLTSGRVQRRFFYRRKTYQLFCKGKQLKLIIRDPYHRLYSCYQDVNLGRKMLYADPAGLQGVFSFKQGLGWTDFLRKVFRYPDYLADRHFRTQSFLFPTPSQWEEQENEVITLADFLTKRPDFQIGSTQNRPFHLNANRNSLPEETLAALRQDPRFLRRYASDLRLFERCLIKQ